MSTPQRIGLVVLAIVVVVGGFAIAKGGGDDDSSTASTAIRAGSEPQETEIDVVGGKPRGGVQEIRVDKGQRVRFEVDSDVADEVHVHGYDIHKDVTPDEDVEFDFPATIDGKFVVELESREEQIAELTVAP